MTKDRARCIIIECDFFMRGVPILTAIVLTFNDASSYAQTTLELEKRGLPMYAFPRGIMQASSTSFYRRYLIRNLPAVLTAHFLMVLPIADNQLEEHASDLMFDLALSIDEPEDVTGYLLSAD
ncbi:MAG: hypothetical protein Q8N36_01460 [bacterium]|nr:hypothetical protein [bacterium]